MGALGALHSPRGDASLLSVAVGLAIFPSQPVIRHGLRLKLDAAGRALECVLARRYDCGSGSDGSPCSCRPGGFGWFGMQVGRSVPEPPIGYQGTSYCFRFRHATQDPFTVQPFQQRFRQRHLALHELLHDRNEGQGVYWLGGHRLRRLRALTAHRKLRHCHCH